MTDLHTDTANPAKPVVDGAALPKLLAGVVLAVPGVARLEPTLSTAGPEILLRRKPTDGIRLIRRAGVVDVDVNIATTATWQVRAVTHQIQTSIADVLHAHGYAAGDVTVSVLTIDAN